MPMTKSPNISMEMSKRQSENTKKVTCKFDLTALAIADQLKAGPL